MVSSTRWSIVLAAQNGDTDALEDLCAKYRPVVVSYLRRCGVGEDAEDLAQESLLALVETLAKAHASAGRFRSLVYAVARHKHLDFRKHEGAKKRGGERSRSAIPLEELAVHGEGDDLFDREWLAALVKRCLTRLRDEHPTLYAALAATVLADRSQAEAARVEGVTAATIRKRVWRGRHQVGAYLRELVEAYGLSRDDIQGELRYLTSLLGPLGAGDGAAPPGGGADDGDA